MEAAARPGSRANRERRVTLAASDPSRRGASRWPVTRAATRRARGGLNASGGARYGRPVPLPPLAWVPDDEVLVTSEDVIHRPGRGHADGWAVAEGTALLRNRAPTMCSECAPEVELRLTPADEGRL